jgi:hypothetical protein
MNTIPSQPTATARTTPHAVPNKSEGLEKHPETPRSEPKDIVDISEKKPTPNSTANTAVGKGFDDFDMEAFQVSMREKLLDMVREAKKSASDAGIPFDAIVHPDSILYEVPEEAVAAEVPEYWNAENTSERIVDYAMSFRSLAPDLNDEEYIEKMRESAIAGFKDAKDILGNLPGSVGKLFNDTYVRTMERFDELLAKAKETPPPSPESV